MRRTDGIGEAMQRAGTAGGGVQTKPRRETLAEQVAQRLLDQIERQPLHPGAALPSEAKLAAEFGVSRPIVCEALKSLAARRIVAIAGGKGTTVKGVTSEPLEDTIPEGRGGRWRSISMRR